ncbi:FecR family protein [Curvibacter sp. APW13]|uniref:FecR family protein n=1 Tax=Curvibacter sp. APW13 TaxID=3077236 RepID=UPI0028E085D5|nr:FecR family protein [Curvibacter sp. APW13]MDT8989457.1 FecR family protein [Curvibacter sp. APW13]
MNFRNRCLVVCALWVGMTASAQTAPPVAGSAEPVGRVKTLRGQATIRTQTQTVEAAVGTPVYLGSEIRTGKDASLGLTFKDSTVLSLGADTRLTVDEYVYDPNQGQYKFGANLGKGALNYISGAIAKARPEAVSVKTPGAVIGVRGTHFVVKAEEEQ